MRIQESGEMYLEAIYVLSKKPDKVRAIDVGQHLGYSKPSVSRALSILKNGGYLEIDENNHIRLTESGLATAQKIYERHTILTRMLVTLGVPEEIASADACRMEHAISDQSFAAIKAHLSHSPK